MQPVSYGSPSQIPMYPNCFDNLTTNGVIVDDVVGYITGNPSPYLQQYVAQRGWNPSVPGRIMPDALPGLPPRGQVANGQPTGDVYQKPVDNNFIAPKKNRKWEKIALAVLLGGLGVFALYKGKKCVNWIKNKIKPVHTPTTPAVPVAPAAPTTPSTPVAPTTPTKLKWYQKIGQWLGGAPKP